MTVGSPPGYFFHSLQYLNWTKARILTLPLKLFVLINLLVAALTELLNDNSNILPPQWHIAPSNMWQESTGWCEWGPAFLMFGGLTSPNWIVQLYSQLWIGPTFLQSISGHQDRKNKPSSDYSSTKVIIISKLKS